MARRLLFRPLPDKIPGKTIGKTIWEGQHLQEKKVEYLELIYDLIFVYLVGRNNELLHELSGGFFTLGKEFL